VTHDVRERWVKLTFHLREGVDSHWKDLVMAVPPAVAGRFSGTSVEFQPPSN